MIGVCENYANYSMFSLMGQTAIYWCTTRRMLICIFEINGTDVSKCGKTIHLENVLGTTNQYVRVFDGIKIFNRSVNRFMSEFGLLQRVAKTNCFINIAMHCTDLNYGRYGVTVHPMVYHFLQNMEATIWFANIFNTINCL